MEQIGGPAHEARGRNDADEDGGRGRKRQARGRQDRGGQEKVIKIDELKSRLPHLVSLHNKAREAAKDLSSAVKAVAEKSGLLATVVRKAVVAKAGDSFDEKAKEAEQLELVFGEIKPQ